MSIKMDPLNRRGPCRRITLAWLFSLSCWLLAAALYGAGGAPNVQILHLASNGQLQPGLPPEVLIGEDFRFKLKVTPDSSLPVGYAPFVEMYLQYDGANCTQPLSGHCDGLQFSSARAEFTTTVLQLTRCPTGLPFVFGVSSSCSSSSSTPQCAGTTSNPPTSCFFGGPPPVCTGESVAGFQKVVLSLPFSSFASNQPDVLLDVTVHVDSFANDGFPLTIKARGGYQYGSNAQGGSPIFDNTTCPMEHSMTTPRVMIVHKEYLGPEDETATGINFPVTYQISVDVANGQTVNNLQVVDCLPGSLVFLSGSPGSCQTVSLGTVSGGSTHPDRSFSFQAYVPDLDTSSGLPVLGPSCKTPVPNQATATAQWTPPDMRETGPVTVSAQDVHTITAKCIALQKTVQMIHDTPAHGATPGDTVQFQMRFQISDFRTFDGIVLDDYLADGLVPIGVPTLQISDKFGSPLSGPIPPVTSVYQNGSTGDVYTCNDGRKMFQPSHLRFDISNALATLDPTGRHGLGILTGGQAGLLFGGPATGTITFRARIADLYQRQQIPSPRNVKKDDTLSNCPEIHGNVLQNADDPAVPQIVVGAGDDDSLAAVTIVTGILRKLVRAVNGNPPTSTPPLVAPGDKVTFRLQLPIPSSDTTGLSFQDFLPQPIFSVPTFPSGPPIPCMSGPLPGPNAAIALPPLCNVNAGDPLLSGPGSNSLLFTYPQTLSNTSNIPQTADLLFTTQVTSAPYVDGLRFNNHVIEKEKNSFGVEFDQTEVAELILGEPKLRIRKGYVRTNDPAAIFSPNPPAPTGVTFNPPGTSPGFTGLINSNNVGLALNSNVSNAQGCDRVRVVIAVENIGSSPKGAFDVRLNDVLPVCLKNPSNLRVVNGLGVPFHCNGGLNCSLLAPLFFSGLGITLDDTANAGALAPYSPTAGTNIAVITFDANLPCTIAPTGCCTNTAKLLNYAGVNGGPNHVTANFSMPFTDTTNPFSDGANVCVQPQLMKSVAATSELVIPGSQGLPLLIGSIVRYDMQITLPVGSSQNLTFTDTLPPGLKWIPNSIPMPHSCELMFDSALIFSPPLPMFNSTFSTLTFNFGTVTNPPGGPRQLEVKCNAQVLNSPPGGPPPNHLGDLRPNQFTVKVTPSSGSPVTYTSNTIPAVIAEPAGVLVKQEIPSSLGPTIATYQLSYTNTGTANAYDIVIQDPVPSSLFIFGVAVTSSSPCTSQVTSSNTVMAKCQVLGPGSSVNLQFSVRGLQLCTPLTNTGTLTYTSLPGPHGTVPNPTGGFPTGASGTAMGERVYQSSASVVTMHCPDLTIQKSHDASLPISGQGSYTFTVTNVGNAQTVPPETVTDTLPAGVQLVSAVGGNGWTCTSSGAAITCTNPSSIPAGGSSTFQVSVILTATAPNGVTNCATVAATPELNLANNQGCDTVFTCVPPPGKLMSWYPLDETVGPYTFDFINHQSIGFYTPASGPDAPQPSPGEVANGLCFSGHNSYVDVSGPNDLASGDLTIDAWVKTTASSGVQPILDKRQSTPDLRGYSLFLVNGQLGFQLANGPGSANCSTSSSSACTNWAATGSQAFVASGQWTFVAVTVQRNQPNGGTFYVNGTAVGTFDPTIRQGNLTSRADLWLAATHPINSPMTTLPGCLDEVEIFTRALSAQDIQSLYKAGSLGKCKVVFH